MLWKGLRFGLLLQLAIGPVWLFVFQTAGTDGFFAGMMGMLAAALIDALYIALSGLGVAVLIARPKVNRVLKLVGCTVLLLFGANTVAGAFGFSLFPNIRLFDGPSPAGAFWQTLFLTASSPMTILLWSGVFSTQVVELGLNRRQILMFGTGCLLATPIGLTFSSFLGSICHSLLPSIVIRGLNLLIGLLLLFFGIRMATKKSTPATAP